jgi:hypothetical protein
MVHPLSIDGGGGGGAGCSEAVCASKPSAAAVARTTLPHQPVERNRTRANTGRRCIGDLLQIGYAIVASPRRFYAKPLPQQRGEPAPLYLPECSQQGNLSTRTQNSMPRSPKAWGRQPSRPSAQAPARSWTASSPQLADASAPSPASPRGSAGAALALFTPLRRCRAFREEEGVSSAAASRQRVRRAGRQRRAALFPGESPAVGHLSVLLEASAALRRPSSRSEGRTSPLPFSSASSGRPVASEAEGQNRRRAAYGGRLG